MFVRALKKPDGRNLRLYSRRQIPAEIEVPSLAAGARPNPHLRWHPLRGEWVGYADYRQHRAFLPPPSHNPLAPTVDPAAPTELPSGPYDVAVFDNLSPAFSILAEPPEPNPIVEACPARGVCEVVVFTQDPTGSLGSLPLWHLELLFEVWADRCADLGSLPEVQYVMPFENRGVEVGVTLHHPHGQIYGYPVVPPIPARELEQQRRYFDEHGRGLIEDLIEAELRDGRRIIEASDEAAAFVPVCARYAYEVWIAPRRAAESICDLTQDERAGVARALKTVLLKFDALWGKPFPYVMVFHQAPSDGDVHPEAHLHIELYPPYRMPDRLKYLAGSELGAGFFTADSLPELKAAELRALEVVVE
jgi:UDPglucose--hexose-1-phosphate uridylyltransferase